MLKRFAHHCLLLMVLGPLGAQAQVSVDPLMEYGGIVSRQVTTSFGQLFHSKFVELWNTKEGFDRFNLVVKERPYPRGGSEILVISTDVVLFRRGMPRDWRTLLAMSAEAVDISFARVSEIEVDRLLFNDPDLAQSGW
jgi:hypothetical protein